MESAQPRTQRWIIIGASCEGALTIAALVDLARRPVDQVRGPKRRWVASLLLVSSAGVLPVGYFRYGRRR